MRDETLELLGLIGILIGMIVAYFLVLDYEPVDAFYFDEDDNAFIEGTIKRKSYNPDSGWTYLEVYSCREFKAFYEGEILKGEGDEVMVKGRVEKGVLSAESIK